MLTARSRVFPGPVACTLVPFTGRVQEQGPPCESWCASVRQFESRVLFAVVLVAAPSAASVRSSNNILVLRCGTLVGRSVPVLPAGHASTPSPSAAVSSDSCRLQHGGGVVWRHKMSLDGSCLMSCTRRDGWQEGMRRDIYLVRPFRSMLVLQAICQDGAQAASENLSRQQGVVKGSVEVDSIQVDGRLDKISSALDIALGALSATVALDWGLEHQAGQIEGSAAWSGAQNHWWNAWTVGHGVGGLSGLAIKSAARHVQPVLEMLARELGPAGSAQVELVCCLKRFTVLLCESSGTHAGAVEVLGSRVRLDIAKTSGIACLTV